MSFPQEILSRIFTFCLPSTIVQGTPQTPSSKTAPLLLAQVSEEWRYLAVKTPSLWSKIVVRMFEVESSRPSINLIQTFLDRSSNHPLEIYLHYKSQFSILTPPDALENISAVLLLIFQHAFRWEAIVLHFPDITAVHFSFPTEGIPPGGAPLLRRLAVNLWRSTFTDFSFLNALKPSPLLKEIFWVVPVPLAISWRGMAIIDLRNQLETRQCMSILREGCQSLLSTSFSFLVPDEGERQVNQEEVTSLPSLSSLRISGTGAYLLSDHLETLDLPALRHLAIEYQSSDANFPAAALAQLFVRCRPPLFHLELKATKISPLDLIACLDTVPHLCQLVLREESDQSDLLDWLAIRPHSKTYPLPNLTHLVFHGDSISVDALAKTIQSRWISLHVVRLNLLAANTDGMPADRGLGLLRGMEEQGLKLIFHRFGSFDRD